jgi:hypothetical protein
LSAKSSLRIRGWSTTVLFAVGLLLCGKPSMSQIAPLDRTFHATKAEVENKLRALHAYSGGKLPILQGFVKAEESLDHFQRGFYQYTLTIAAVNDNETKVRVSANITAWYKGESPSNAGYRVLPSNGRLESDLLDNLADELKSAVAAEPATPSAPVTSKAAVPKSPSTTQATASIFRTPVGVSPAPPSAASGSSSSQDAATEKRIQQLTEEGNTLREILRNQTHPDNLAVVKAAHTPLLDRAAEGAKAILIADADDEFQIVDTVGDWVHVQVSGIARGWVRRDQVDMPGAVGGSLTTIENDPRTFDEPAFHQTREEVSLFPGKWQPLDGKKVKIIWVAPQDSKSFGNAPKLNLIKSVFRKAYPDVSATPDVAGVVVILDSQDGGMAATTLASLQQWQAGHLPDKTFWKQCWVDPADAFKFED